VLCTCRQQGKACSDDIKVFSRALPWEHIGQERGVRVFIARALAPGEVPPPTPAAAAAAAAKLQAGKWTKQQQESEAAGEQQQLSRKQRKLRERAARIRALQEASADAAAAAPAAAAAGSDAASVSSLDSPQQSDGSRDALVIIADQHPSSNKQRLQHNDDKQLAAAAGDAVVLELPLFRVRSKEPSYSEESSSCSTGITSSSASSITATNPSAASATPRIHACIVLDPIYRDGAVIGYTAERSFLHPQGVKGAVKLLQRHALALLKAEGLSLLNLGLAVGYEVKPGEWLCKTRCLPE
jgi:hypothetical protein